MGVRGEVAGGIFGAFGAQAASMSFWAARGLARLDGRPLGAGEAGLLVPAGPDGPAFLVTRNFEADLPYNAAESYALSIASRRSVGGRPGHRHALADRRSRAVARRAPRIAALLASAAMTSANRTVRLGTRPERRSPTLRAKTV